MIKDYKIYKGKNFDMLPLYLIYILFFAFRLSTGSINIIYLINTGVSLSNAVFLNALFSISSLLFSLYCLKYANSNRNVILISLFMFIVYSFGMGLAPSILALVIAQITYGISLSGMSASYFSWISTILSHRVSNDKDLTSVNNQFKHITMRFGSLLAAFTSTIIPLLLTMYNISLRFMFFINIFIGFVLLAWYALYSTRFRFVDNINYDSNSLDIKSVFKIIIKDNALVSIVIISFLLMMALVPVFALWQPYFKELLSVTDKQLIYYLITINFLTFLSQYIFNNVPKKLYHSNFLILSIFSLMSFMLLLLSVLLGLYIYLSIFLFMLFQGTMSVVTYSKDNYILSIYNNKSRKLISIMDILMRIVSIVYSIIIGIIIIYVSISNFFILTSIFFLLIFIVGTIQVKKKL